MKKSIFTILLSALLLFSASACGAAKAPPAKASEPAASAKSEPESLPEGDIFVGEETLSSSASLEEQAGGAVEQKETRLVVEGATLYRGVIGEFAVSPDNGKTVLLLTQADGTDFGYPTLQLMLDDSTKFAGTLTQAGKETELSSNSSNDATPQFGNGSYLEVYFDETKKNPDGSFTALTVTVLDSPDMILFNGTIAELTPDSANPGKGDLLVNPFTENAMPFLFHYDENTVFVTPFDSLKVGSEVNVLHSAASTRSIPPQSAAFEVRPYVKGENAQLAITLG